MQFDVGDVVCLKSGSQKMTVETVENGQAVCVWEIASGIAREAFDVRMIEKWKPLRVSSARMIDG